MLIKHFIDFKCMLWSRDLLLNYIRKRSRKETLHFTGRNLWAVACALELPYAHLQTRHIRDKRLPLCVTNRCLARRKSRPMHSWHTLIQAFLSDYRLLHIHKFQTNWQTANHQLAASATLSRIPSGRPFSATIREIFLVLERNLSRIRSCLCTADSSALK